MRRRLLTRLAVLLLLLAAVLWLARRPERPAVNIAPALATAMLPADPDDPAIWVHPGNPERSLILATVKAEAPLGALAVFDLDGNLVQMLSGINRPNNVDVEYGLLVGGKPTDIAVLTERLATRLRVFQIAPATGAVAEISSPGGLEVFRGEPGERAAPMGIALYRRPRDGAVFAIVSRKVGPPQGYLWQYRLEDDGAGRVKATKVREFGAFSGRAEIEAVAVDDALGYVYYADEGDGIHKWHADPDDPDAGRELAVFGRAGFSGDREGIAIYTRDDGTGYIICTDQLSNNSEYRIYPREGSSGRPHDHARLLKVVRGGADATDGIEATSAALGPKFPHGVLVAMNSGGRNFFVYRWESVALSGTPRLKLGKK